MTGQDRAHESVGSDTPLAGLRVVEVSLGLSLVGAGLASSLPGSLLRHLGADVVRVESTPPSTLDAGLDLARAWNRGKEIVGVGSNADDQSPWSALLPAQARLGQGLARRGLRSMRRR